MSLFMPERIEQKVIDHLINDEVKPAGNYVRKLAHNLFDIYVKSVSVMVVESDEGEDENTAPDHKAIFEGQEIELPNKSLVNYVDGELGIHMDEQDNHRQKIADKFKEGRAQFDECFYSKVKKICQNLYANYPSKLEKIIG